MFVEFSTFIQKMLQISRVSKKTFLERKMLFFNIFFFSKNFMISGAWALIELWKNFGKLSSEAIVWGEIHEKRDHSDIFFKQWKPQKVFSKSFWEAKYFLNNFLWSEKNFVQEEGSISRFSIDFGNFNSDLINIFAFRRVSKRVTKMKKDFHKCFDFAFFCKYLLNCDFWLVKI